MPKREFIRGGAVCSLSGDCPDFRGHRREALVGENGTVPFRLDFDDFDRPDTKTLTSPFLQ